MIKAQKLYQIANQGPVDKISLVFARTPLDPNLCFTGGFTQFNHPKATGLPSTRIASHISCKSDLAGRDELASEEDVLSKPIQLEMWLIFQNSKPINFSQVRKDL